MGQHFSLEWWRAAPKKVRIRQMIVQKRERYCKAGTGKGTARGSKSIQRKSRPHADVIQLFSEGHVCHAVFHQQKYMLSSEGVFGNARLLAKSWRQEMSILFLLPSTLDDPSRQPRTACAPELRGGDIECEESFCKQL